MFYFDEEHMEDGFHAPTGQKDNEDSNHFPSANISATFVGQPEEHLATNLTQLLNSTVNAVHHSVGKEKSSWIDESSLAEPFVCSSGKPTKTVEVTLRLDTSLSHKFDEKMSQDKNKRAGFDQGHPRAERFFLGDSDSESDSEEELRTRRLYSESEGSEDGCALIGGPPTTMGFVLDEDSGIGMSNSPDEDSNSNKSSAQLVPLRSVNIGTTAPKSNRSRRRRHFDDFYILSNDHLGSGAYASVRTAISKANSKEYAVKLVSKHEPGHTRSRILREVEIFKICKNHPNIVQLIEWFEDANCFYLVFEKMRGGPLLNHIQRKVCFTEQEASMVTKDIATALKHLHERGVAHRDVKPENILCTDLDRVSPVKLCDLDLASKPTLKNFRKTSRPLHNVSSEPDLASPVGSAEFMAPEVVDTFVGDALKYDKRCDMWSLGVIIYIMLCGYTPFYGECERDNCGWDQGQPCNDCQENLFHRIQQGEFDFPEEEWANISREAKDLISHLLVKNVRLRFTAVDVLNHPWIKCGAPETPLQTANNLFRNDSARDMHQMNEHFNVMNRFTAARLSARLEETIPSLGSSVENDPSPLDSLVNQEKADEGLEKAVENNSSSTEVNTNKLHFENNVLESEPLRQLQVPSDDQYVKMQVGQDGTHMVYDYQHNHQQQTLAYPPPMINMNGMLIYAPPMAQSQTVFALPAQHYAVENVQPMYQYNPQYFGRYSQQVMNGAVGYYNAEDGQHYYQAMPQNNYNRLDILNYPFNPSNNLEHIRARQSRVPRNSAYNRSQRSLTPNTGYQKLAGRPRLNANTNLSHRHLQNSGTPWTNNGSVSHHLKNGNAWKTNNRSLRTAMSQMGLETCQNAMARQDSAKELGVQSREGQVHV